MNCVLDTASTAVQVSDPTFWLSLGCFDLIFVIKDVMNEMEQSNGVLQRVEVNQQVRTSVSSVRQYL